MLNKNTKMKKLQLLLMSAVLGMSAVSCDDKKNENQAETELEIVDLAHNSENSLDWAGKYAGILPCADCEGIETKLTLNDDLTYVLSQHYLTDKANEDVLKEGKFSWNEDGLSIQLEGVEGASQFKVEEGQLRMLDTEGKVVEGELANHYVLGKMGNLQVEDQKWQLVELNGKAIDGNAETHYLVFHSKDGRIEAKANCNVLNLPYEIKNQLQLTVGDGITTMMACPDNTEAELLEVFKTVDNLSTDGETLSLNKARMAPLAKFALVK